LRRSRSLPARGLRDGEIPARLLRSRHRELVPDVRARARAGVQKFPRVAEGPRAFDIFDLPPRALLPESPRLRLLAQAQGLDSPRRVRRDGLELLPPTRRLLRRAREQRLRASELRRADPEPPPQGLAAGQLPRPAHR